MTISECRSFAFDERLGDLLEGKAVRVCSEKGDILGEFSLNRTNGKWQAQIKCGRRFGECDLSEHVQARIEALSNIMEASKYQDEHQPIGRVVDNGVRGSNDDEER